MKWMPCPGGHGQMPPPGFLYLGKVGGGSLKIPYNPKVSLIVTVYGADVT